MALHCIGSVVLTWEHSREDPMDIRNARGTRYTRVAIVAASVALVWSAFPQTSASPSDEYGVVWDSPGKNYKDSMPIGNGDLGLNLSTEENGDVVFLIDKTDAWTENSELVKLGRIRVRFDASPFRQSPAFRQILNPKEGAIEIRGTSSAVLRVWADANAPVVHLEMKSGKPVSMQASAEIWRRGARRTNAARGNDEMTNGLREQAGNPERSSGFRRTCSSENYGAVLFPSHFLTFNRILSTKPFFTTTGA